ncbi:MAG: glycine cleavage system protein GcvH [Limisphaerales bacterium]
MSTQVPDNLRYAKSHEWVRLEGDVAVIGITDHAQHELTDIVFAEVPAAGRVVKAGEAAAVVESVKTASDIYAPIGGEVVATNAELAANPALVNSDPFGAGWFFKLKPANRAELEALLTPAAYRAQIGG